MHGTTRVIRFLPFFESGKWGAVCANDWSYDEALTVCRHLGYPNALNRTVGVFGQSRGRIWIDVNCPGHMSNLKECSIQFTGRNVRNCDQATQAEVVCGK